jgi:hypothetical protein
MIGENLNDSASALKEEIEELTAEVDNLKR